MYNNKKIMMRRVNVCCCAGRLNGGVEDLECGIYCRDGINRPLCMQLLKRYGGKIRKNGYTG